MSDILILRARIRPRDKDLRQSIEQLELEEGELSDMLRDGLRMKLREMGVLKAAASITPTDARQIAQELMKQNKKAPPSE